jgi:signal transduction histidine kinase
MDIRILFLAVGFGAQVVADFSYLSSGVGKTFAEAEPKFVLFLVTAACYLVTAALIDRPPNKREFPEDEAPLWAFVWPYLLAAALLATHVGRYRSLNPGETELLMLDAMVIIGIVVFLRQVLMIHRNRVRVEKQRTELVASVSHELRTPLTAMVGYLALLDDHGDEFPEDARREMISEATGQSKHMARLVSDLVMLARGDHRHLPLELDEASLSSIITAALRGVDPESTKIEEELVRDANVRVDADRLQQALANMLSNAVRYGGDRALLSARLEGEDLIIEVHDNGDGVPTRYETAIWQRFERGAHRLNAMTPGLGIGLAIVSAVAVSHGGKASYRTSERLGGACFSLVIPGCLVRRSEGSRKIEVSS